MTPQLLQWLPSAEPEGHLPLADDPQLEPKTQSQSSQPLHVSAGLGLWLLPGLAVGTAAS